MDGLLSKNAQKNNIFFNSLLVITSKCTSTIFAYFCFMKVSCILPYPLAFEYHALNLFSLLLVSILSIFFHCALNVLTTLCESLLDWLKREIELIPYFK